MKTADTVRIFVDTPGDPSVGIGTAGFTMDLPKYLLKDAGDRDDVRELVKELAENLLDNGTPTVTFENECPDCGFVAPEYAKPRTRVVPDVRPKYKTQHKCPAESW